MTTRGQLSQKLAGLLVVLGSVTIAGVAVRAYVVAPGVTRADLVDAGVTQDFTPRKLSCWVVGDACPDGGACQLSTVAAVAKTLPTDGGLREVIFPRSALRFRAALDQFDERSNCRVTNLTWAQVSDFLADPADEEPSGRCQATAGPLCLLLDGGSLLWTVPAEETQGGAGCIPRLLGGPAGGDPIPEACR